MEIIPYDEELAGEVARLYNHAVADLPHCYPVDAERVAAVVGREQETAAEHTPRDEVAFLAKVGGEAVGFANAAVGEPEEWGAGLQGVIRFLYYLPGRRAAGLALLEAAERHIEQHRVPSIQAFPQDYRYPFYHLHAAYLSDRLGHVEGLLGMSGYERVRGETIMDWPDFDPAVPPLPDASAEVEVSFPEGKGRLPGVEVSAELGETHVGECVCISCGEHAPDPEAQEWVEVSGLGVTEDLQARGWGRYLLLRALREAREAGYRHAAISTWWTNYRALLFYSNYGFRAVDRTYGWGREV